MARIRFYNNYESNFEFYSQTVDENRNRNNNQQNCRDFDGLLASPKFYSYFIENFQIDG